MYHTKCLAVLAALGVAGILVLGFTVPYVPAALHGPYGIALGMAVLILWQLLIARIRY